MKPIGGICGKMFFGIASKMGITWRDVPKFLDALANTDDST